MKSPIFSFLSIIIVIIVILSGTCAENISLYNPTKAIFNTKNGQSIENEIFQAVGAVALLSRKSTVSPRQEEEENEEEEEEDEYYEEDGVTSSTSKSTTASTSTSAPSKVKSYEDQVRLSEVAKTLEMIIANERRKRGNATAEKAKDSSKNVKIAETILAGIKNGDIEVELVDTDLASALGSELIIEEVDENEKQKAKNSTVKSAARVRPGVRGATRTKIMGTTLKPKTPAQGFLQRVGGFIVGGGYLSREGIKGGLAGFRKSVEYLEDIGIVDELAGPVIIGDGVLTGLEELVAG